MKKRARTAAALFGIALFAGGAAACGDPYANESADKFYITVGYNSTVADEENILNAWKLDFERNYGPAVGADNASGVDLSRIGIRLVPFTSIGDEMRASITTGKWNDMNWIAGDQHADFSEAGYFVNLRPLFDADPDIDLEDYYEIVVESTSYSPDESADGKTPGVWFGPRDYNKLTILYNKDMFQAAGVTDADLTPWNTETFLKLCAKLRTAMDAGQNGLKLIHYPLNIALEWSPAIQTLIRGFGGQLFDTSVTDFTGADSNKGIVLDSAESITAYKKIGEMYNKGYLGTGDLFSARRAAMAVTVRPDVPNATAKIPNYDFLSMPFDQVGVGCTGYTISSANASKALTNRNGETLKKADGTDATVQEVCWEFVKYYMGEQGQNVFGALGTGVPVLKSLADSGDWLSYGSRDLNHAAFIGNHEVDFSLNDAYMYPMKFRSNVKSEAEAVMAKLRTASTWSGTPFADASINERKWTTSSWDAQGNWKALEDTVAAVADKARRAAR